MITEAQFYQIENAKLLIGDPEVIRDISNPELSADQMERLIVTACSHPRAMCGQRELRPEDRLQMEREIRQAVHDRAEEFLKGNHEAAARTPPNRSEVLMIER